MILFVIVNRTEASQLMLTQSRQSNLGTARPSTDGNVLLSFRDKDGIPSEFVGRKHYTSAEIAIIMQQPEWTIEE